MALAPGTRLGPYEITAQIGAGGMGEVYRATDTNLGRDVAIKVLPEAFAQDAERLARFDREARTLAALNHPNIAQIHGLEKSDGTIALVMELVEGPTLADRIAQGAIPVDEALPIAKQIAEALEAAHEQGIIHRDLKPANVKVRPDGTVKVLDFGLAKAMEPAAGESPSASMSPTITTPAMTQAGMILGTAAYMSPEQARGRPVDKRADIWAFGCVLYEMLTGRLAFDEEDVGATLGAVIHKQPGWNLVPALEPTLGSLLRQCLEKDPKQRVPDIAIMRLTLSGAFQVGDQLLGVGEVAKPGRWWRAVPVAVAVAIATAIATTLGIGLWRPTSGPPVSRYVIELPAGHDIGSASGPNLTLSPDGSRLAYVALGSAGAPMIWVRRRDQLDPTPVPGTEGATSPTFSPDGERIAYLASDREVRVASLDGQRPVSVARELDVSAENLTWGPDGFLYLGGVAVREATQFGAVVRLPETGGPLEAVTFLDVSESEVIHHLPQVLPDGRGVLFSIEKTFSRASDVELAVSDAGTGEHRVLVRAVFGRYVRTGHLVYVEADGSLRAAPFDIDRLELVGPPVTQSSGVAVPADLEPDLTIADDGTLVYLGGGVTELTELVWVDRTGQVQPVDPGWTGFFRGPRLSEDDARVAVARVGSPSSVWIKQLDRGPSLRLDVDQEPALAYSPAWTPDGQSVTFGTAPVGDQPGVRTRRADGTGPARRELAVEGMPTWSADGRWLIVRTAAAADLTPNILGYRPGVDSAPTLLVENALTPTFSPDGRWMAYSSFSPPEQLEVYVVPFPNTEDARYGVSTEGGHSPRWSHEGGELFYVASDGMMMAASVSTANGFAVSERRALFDARPYSNFVFSGDYDVSADDQRFLMIRPAGGGAGSNQLVVVENFFTELERLVPTGD